MPINSRLKTVWVIGQRKAFCMQTIPEWGCGKKQTVDIYILLKSRNEEKITMQNIRITSRPPTRMKKVKQFREFR